MIDPSNNPLRSLAIPEAFSMGACGSKQPASLPGDGNTVALESVEAPMAPTPGALEQTLSVRVNSESGKVKLGRTSSGRIVVKVEQGSPHVSQGTPAVPVDGPEFEALKVLEKMGLGLHFSPGDPFIGQLVLTVVEASGLGPKAGPKLYVTVTGENDKSVPKHVATVEGDTVLFAGAKFVFFVLFSNSKFKIALKGPRGPSKYTVGAAILEVSHLKQGFERAELALLDNKGVKVGTVKVDVDYHWLRGTKDDGTYTVVNRVIVNRASRAVRKTWRAMRAAVEAVSQVNHRILSHDNVWGLMGTYDAAAATVVAPGAEAGDAAAADRDAEELQVDDSDAAAAAAQAAEIEEVAGQAELAMPECGPASQLRYQLEDVPGRATACSRMTQGLLMEALGRKEGDSPDVAQLKETLLAIMAPTVDRLEMLEASSSALALALEAQQQRLAAVAGAAQQAGGQAPAIKGHGHGHAEEQAQDGESNGELVPQISPFISGHFEYGLARPASKRTVLLFMRKSHLAGAPTMLPEFLGTHKTKWNGDLGPIQLPPTICRTPGHYEVMGMLPDDYTSAKGSMFVLAPGTKAVVFDMDGTITVGDQEVVAQFGLDALAGSTALASQLSHKYDLRPRRHALQVVRAWAAKGYQPIYLSGRQGSYFNLTQAWLIKHRYPPGPIHLTRTHMPTLPMYFSVGIFKVKYLEGLKQKGIELYAAFGNTPTDIRAYEAAGIPKERTFIVGPHGGKAGTVKVDSYTDLLPKILEFPDAAVPIPYTELLISERPGYHRVKKVKGADGVEREVSSVTTIGPHDAFDDAASLDTNSSMQWVGESGSGAVFDSDDEDGEEQLASTLRGIQEEEEDAGPA